MHETLALNLACDFVQVRKNVGGRRALWPKLFFLRQTQRPDAGKDFQPRQKEPAQRRDHTQDPAAGDEIDRQIRRDQNANRTRFLRKGALETAQRNTEHRHAERQEKAEEHYG